MGRYKRRELPGDVHRAMLRMAGFEDVAARGTPSPIVLTTPLIINHEPMNITFTDGNVKSLRDMMLQVFREESMKWASEGFRATRAPVVW